MFVTHTQLILTNVMTGNIVIFTIYSQILFLSLNDAYLLQNPKNNNFILDKQIQQSS